MRAGHVNGEVPWWRLGVEMALVRAAEKRTVFKARQKSLVGVRVTRMPGVLGFVEVLVWIS
jgi:hypothetical protein